MRAPRFVTLTTDIGWAYAAQMKAVLARRAPNAIVVDIAHDIPPHGIREAAFLLGEVAPQFPRGTVHVVVVDPGVGGPRAALGVETRDGSFLLGPDNGVLSGAVRSLGNRRSVRLDPRRFAPEIRTSPTFEGRDVFAPAAAVLATGGRLPRLGVRHPVAELHLPRPRLRADGVSGEVVHVDVFGNAITNVPGSRVPSGLASVLFRTGRGRARRLALVRTYGDADVGGLALLISSFGLLELAERNGSAAKRLRLAVGDPVELVWDPPRGGAGK